MGILLLNARTRTCGWATVLRKHSPFLLLLAIVAAIWFRGDIVHAIRLAGVELNSPVVAKWPLPGNQSDVRAALHGVNRRLYTSVTLEFQPSHAPQLYENIFQTAPYDEGIRVELHKSTIAVIIANRDAPDRPLVLVLSNRLAPKQWHKLTLAALDEDFVSAELDGAKFLLESKNIRISGTAFRVGVGFDDTRTFTGAIRNATVCYTGAMSPTVATLLYLFLLGIPAITLLARRRLAVVGLWRRRTAIRHRVSGAVRRFSACRAKVEAATELGRTTIWFLGGVAALIAATAYVGLAAYLIQKAGSVASSLLPGYTQSPGGEPFKRELMAFLLIQCGFVAVLVAFWISSITGWWGLFSRLPRSVIFVLPFICIAAILSSTDLLIRVFLGVATGFFVLATLESAGLLGRAGSVVTVILISPLRRLFRERRSGTQASSSGSSIGWFAFVGVTLALGLTLLWPAKQAWYPVVLPNDYYEAVDSFQESGTAVANTVDRDVVQGCMEGSSTTACEDADKLYDAFTASSYWQAATGRVLYHHSYVFIPAKHWVTHGLDNAVSYLYGYGNTIFHGLLMTATGGTLGSYFLTYPLALLAGLLVIAGCVGYITRSRWLGAAAFLICVYELYAIGFTASFLAASFSPLRYAGLALQIASVFFYLREPARRTAAIPIAAALSLFWNTEFGLLGLVGQGLALLAPHLRVSPFARASSLFALVAISLTFYAVSRPSIDIVNSIFLGFFQVNMPAMGSRDIGVGAIYILLIQAAATLATFTFSGAERDARLCVLPVVALSLIKVIFNPSPPHMAITLAFILPMMLLFLPQPTLIIPEGRRARWGTAIKLTAILVLGYFCWNSGMAYVAEADAFRSRFVEPFVSKPWVALGEELPSVVPEAPVVDRVTAIAETARVDDVLLLLSPFDHLLSFYANPAKYCGHFELISNIATQQTIDQVVACVARTPNVLVVYDHDLLKACPDLSALGIETECGKKLLAKTNVQRIFERLLPDLVEVGNRGGLIFYRRRSMPI